MAHRVYGSRTRISTRVGGDIVAAVDAMTILAARAGGSSDARLSTEAAQRAHSTRGMSHVIDR